MRFVLCIAILLCNFLILAQDPNFFTIGKEELSTAKIYTFLEAEDGSLYAGTDQGLYRYRNGKFNQIKAAENQQGDAVFNLVEDHLGNVFCCNFGGQVFKVVNESLEVFVEIPEDKLESLTYIEFDANNNLIVASDYCYRVQEGEWEQLPMDGKSTVTCLKKMPDGTLIYAGYTQEDIFYRIETSGKVTKVNPKKDLNIDVSGYWLQDVITVGDETVMILAKDPNRTYQLAIGGKNARFETWQTKSIKPELIYISENEFWIRTARLEVYQCIFDEKGNIHYQTFFEDELLSTVTKGKYGEYYFGTFGNGVRVVEDLEVLDYYDDFSNENYTSILYSPDLGILRSTRNGLVLKGYGMENTEVIQSENGSIDKLFLTNELKIAPYSSGYVTSIFNIEKGNEIGSLKDVECVDSHTVLLASATGLFIEGNHPEGFNYRVISEELAVFTDLKERCRSVEFDSENQILYVATYGELLMVKPHESPKQLKLNDEAVVAYSLEFSKGCLWVATSKFGVLMFKDGDLKLQFTEEDGLKSNLVRKLIVKDDRVYIQSGSALQILDLNYHIIQQIGRAEGMNEASVKDFDVGDSHLWVLFRDKIRSFSTADLKEKKAALEFAVDSVMIGDKTFVNSLISVPYDKDGLFIHYHYNSVLFESEAFMQYRIASVNEKWTEEPAINGIVNLGSVPSGKNKVELRLRYRDQYGDSKFIEINKSQPFWGTWWFNGIIFCLIIVIGVLIYRFRIKRLKKKNEELIQQQRIKSELAESQLRALRSQMNPHFIFNSLNAIQDLVLDEDTDGSYDYISMFAKLVRNILNYSNQDYIYINDEIKFLETYLTLEKLRFKDEFEYEITYENGRDVKIPSLLLQPFVENALIHGLMHKAGTKKLSIHFYLNETLTCEIIDNGIGRKKSGEINERRGGHVSFALKAVEERLKILNSENQNGEYEIFDIMEGGEVMGTRVFLIIPYTDDH